MAVAAIGSSQVVGSVSALQQGGSVPDAPKQGHLAASSSQDGNVSALIPQAPANALTAAAIHPPRLASEYNLFDYLGTVKNDAAGRLGSPQHLFGTALDAFEATIQQVQSALGAHRSGAAGSVKPPASKVGSQQSLAGRMAASLAEPGGNDPAALLERSISVMWAAANLEVVTSSVTAVSSSTNSLIKQQ